MKQFSWLHASKLGVGDKTMPLPQEVYRRLQARAATDLDLASLLAIFTKPNKIVSGPAVDQAIKDAESMGTAAIGP